MVGPNCTAACPGVDAATGAGEACGGHGACDRINGTCACEPCYELDAATGTCVASACPECGDHGACVCNATSGARECDCVGAYGGAACDVCLCENGGRCNAVTRACDCPPTSRGDFCEKYNMPECPAGTYFGMLAAGLALDDFELEYVEGVTYECAACEAGTFSEGNTTACQLCPAGRYAADAGAAVCSSCVGDVYSSEGASECLGCPPGTYANRTGRSVCAACPPGRHSAGTVGGGCPLCTRGRFTNSYDAAARHNCSACEPNTYADARGAARSRRCASGSASAYSVLGYATCAPCSLNASCARGPNGALVRATARATAARASATRRGVRATARAARRRDGRRGRRALGFALASSVLAIAENDATLDLTVARLAGAAAT